MTPGWRHAAAWGLAALALASASADPAWLARAVPAQAAVLKLLMPGFELKSVALEFGAGQHRLAARAVSTGYVVLQGRAWPPGLDLQAHTPARQLQRQAALVFASMALLAWRRPGLRCGTWAGVFGASIALLVGITPLVLAGQMWGLGLDGRVEPSWQFLSVLASDLVLHGGDIALCLTAPALALVSRAASPAQGAPVASRGQPGLSVARRDPA